MKEINGVKQPEAGDVFKASWGTYYRVDDKNPNSKYYRCYVIEFDDNTNEHFISVEDEMTIAFLLSMKYLGKAKNPITSIFEVE